MKKVFLFMMALFCALAVFAQKGDLNLSDPIKADPNVTIGKLDNGLTYYIRRNTYPKDRVEFRLAVNAGSTRRTTTSRAWRTSPSTWPSTASRASRATAWWTTCAAKAWCSALTSTPTPASTRPSI